jgi:hypothetical protein
MTALEAFQLMTSTGVLAGGIGVLKWALSMERRVMKLEVKTGIREL